MMDKSPAAEVPQLQKRVRELEQQLVEQKKRTDLGEAKHKDEVNALRKEVATWKRAHESRAG